MNKRMVATGIGAALTLGLAVAPVMAQQGHEGHGHGHEGHAHAKKTDSTNAKPLCPVMGEPINFSISVATDDGPVFMCCPGCIKKYEAYPSKYSVKVAAQRKALAGRPKVQVKCPVSGNPADADLFIEVGGKKVNFCCMGCSGKYKKNPAAFKTALANSYTYQTKCPVMDEEIDSLVSTTLASGKTVYFCCKGCDKKFAKNPTKYAKALASQGYDLDASDLKSGK